jgi:hypothetical protein
MEEMMTASAIPSVDQKIDVLRSVEDGYSHAFRNWSALADLAWLPFLIVVVSQLIAYGLSNGGIAGALVGQLIYTFGFLVFATIFVTRWHRFVLLGESHSDELFTPAWRHFFFRAIELTLIVIVGWVVLAYLSLIPPRWLTVPLFPIIGGIALVIVSVRMSLSFPAAAIDRPLTLREAWDRMSGNTWRVFASAGICWIPFSFAGVGLEVVGTSDGWFVWLVSQILAIGVYFLGITVVSGFLSEAYRQIVGDPRVAVAR